MKIVHIQASMPPSGNAAYRLSTIMRNYGLDSYVLNLMPSFKKDNAYVNVAKRGRIFGKIVDYGVKKIKTFRIRKNVYFYTPLPAIGRDLVSISLIKEADVIYVHWVSGLLSINNIENLAKTGKPIFFLCMICGLLLEDAIIVWSAKGIVCHVKIVICSNGILFFLVHI